MLDNFARPLGMDHPLLVFGSLAAMPFYRARGKAEAFLASTAYIVGMLGGAAFALYPYLLPASTGPVVQPDDSQRQDGSLQPGVGLIWWSFGMVLAIGYFTFLYRSFRGKVTLGEDHGY